MTGGAYPQTRWLSQCLINGIPTGGGAVVVEVAVVMCAGAGSGASGAGSGVAAAADRAVDDVMTTMEDQNTAPYRKVGAITNSKIRIIFQLVFNRDGQPKNH